MCQFARALILMGCDKETRNGELSLSGATPVRIIDESGKTTEFGNGPVKIEFSANAGVKFD